MSPNPATAWHNEGRAAYHAGIAYDARELKDLAAPSHRQAWLQGWMAAATETANEAEAKAIAAGRQPDPWARSQSDQLKIKN